MAENFLTKQAGPLPMWAWGMFGLAGVILLMQYRKSQSSAAQPQQQAATGPAASTGGQPNSIFFLPNGAAPNQVGVNFNSRPNRADQQISSQFVTTSNMYAAQIEQAVYHSNPNDPTSIAVDSQEIIQANPQLDWTRAIPKGTSVNIPVGIGTQG